MPVESIRQFLNPVVIIALLTLSLFLTLFVERRRLARIQERRDTGGSAMSWLRRSRTLLFWTEFAGTFFLVLLVLVVGSVGIRVLALSSSALFGSPWIGLAMGVFALGALVGIIILGTD